MNFFLLNPSTVTVLEALSVFVFSFRKVVFPKNFLFLLEILFLFFPRMLLLFVCDTFEGKTFLRYFSALCFNYI